MEISPVEEVTMMEKGGLSDLVEMPRSRRQFGSIEDGRKTAKNDNCQV